MCGLAGFLDPTAGGDAARALAQTMADALAHRGPDDSAAWVDPAGGCALGHRRLAIIDLSPAGAQPMTSACGRWVIAYNGEIYNAAELRDGLTAQGLNLRGHSDTEILLEHVARHGLDDALTRIDGMVAAALWDRHEKRLHLIRDRFGEKPLYWRWDGRRLLFASELKALRPHPDWTPELDPAALAGYFRRNVVPAPRTIYAGVWMLPPGCGLTAAPGAPPQLWRWADPAAEAAAGLAEPLDDPAAAEEQLDALLFDAVRRRMVSDAPLGAFLSGGIDSSLVAAMMARAGGPPPQTFTIGYGEGDYDESHHAAAVAAHLGTDHHALYVTPQEALAAAPEIADIWDEPFADASQIPTLLVSRFARQRVTVALTGDGGDELFGGYNRYSLGERLAGLMARTPRRLRMAGGRLIQTLPPSAWDSLARLHPRRPRRAGDKLHKLAGLIDAADGDALYQRMVDPWAGAPIPFSAAGQAAAAAAATQAPPGAEGLAESSDYAPEALIHRMRLADLRGYLPDDILTKVDRAGMSASLEARAPFLDKRLAAFAWRLPRPLLTEGGVGKTLLRRVLARHVPPALWDRPKMGFSVPIEFWLRGPLRPWGEDLLAELAADPVAGWLDLARIRALWAEHLSGRRNHQYPLWGVLMFAAWRRRWREA